MYNAGLWYMLSIHVCDHYRCPGTRYIVLTVSYLYGKPRVHRSNAVLHMHMHMDTKRCPTRLNRGELSPTQMLSFQAPNGPARRGTLRPRVRDRRTSNYNTNWGAWNPHQH